MSLTLQQQTAFYQGKVRDVYTIQNKYVVMVASNRISAFDVILPKPIPFKGAVLNQLAKHFLESTKEVVPNWFISSPLPHVSVGYLCKPYPVEMVIRGYLAGHAWRTYQSGARILCGVSLPEGLKENDPLPEPIITPSTKAHEGHDEDISREEIISRGMIPENEYLILEEYTRKLFHIGQSMAQQQGYEFGNLHGEVRLIDEIHTPDSSRYFILDGFDDRQKHGEKQQQLSKEFVREWLIANNFMGKEGQAVPEMTPEFVHEVSEKYIGLYEKITSKQFQRNDVSEEESEVVLNHYLKELIGS
jgi:phosphoribosylaminoimidazole-succinocarboxamide synthase